MRWYNELYNSEENNNNLICIKMKIYILMIDEWVLSFDLWFNRWWLMDDGWWWLLITHFTDYAYIPVCSAHTSMFIRRILPYVWLASLRKLTRRGRDLASRGNVSKYGSQIWLLYGSAAGQQYDSQYGFQYNFSTGSDIASKVAAAG